MTETSSGLQGAADRIRETAKWLTVSLAALGGVLVAGTQLSDIGSLEVGSHRFILAIGGGCLVAAGTIVILLATVWTATTPAVSLHSLATKTPAGAEGAVEDATLLGGHTSVKVLKDEYVAALTERKNTQAAHLANPSDTALKTAAEAADARALGINQTGAELLKVVSYSHLIHRWHWSEFWIIVGGTIAAAGIGLFAWAANPPEDEVASVASPNVITSPAGKRMRLTPEGVKVLGDKLGRGCKTEDGVDVLVLGKTDIGPDVLVSGSPDCKPVRLILGQGWGTVADLVPKVAPPPTPSVTPTTTRT